MPALYGVVPRRARRYDPGPVGNHRDPAKDGAVVSNPDRIAIRPYVARRDRSAVLGIWREVAWIEEDEQEPAFDTFLEGGPSWVSEIHGEAECHVSTMPGTLRHGVRDLAMCAVSSVTTGRVGRKQGLAGAVTAHAVAHGAANGAVVAVLGMFEQGFYDRLGFGTGGYEREISFDPATLTVPTAARPPVRLTAKHAEEMHAGRLATRRGHGSCAITPTAFTRAEVGWEKTGFGLGFRDDDGRLTHHFWGRAKGEQGPYSIDWLAFENDDQLVELLGVIRNLGDQVRLVKLIEPARLQLQDVLRTPFRSRVATRRSDLEATMIAMAFWQARILDLERAVASSSTVEPITFGLRLIDPIERYLPAEARWRGIGGEWTVRLGPESRVERGLDGSLPVLEASVGAFTRLWLGVRPASSLAITDRLAGSPALIDALDDAIRLPPPQVEWMF